VSPREKFLKMAKELSSKPLDPKKWARDILADPNYKSDLGIAMAKKALDPNNLRGLDNES